MLPRFLDGALVRLRLAVRRTAHSLLGGALIGACLAFLMAAGLVAIGQRFGVLPALLTGAAVVGLAGTVVLLLGRRHRAVVPEPASSQVAARVEAADEAQAHGASRLLVGERLRRVAPLAQEIHRALPPGAEAAIAVAAARQLAKRPVSSLGAAAVIGAAYGLSRIRRRHVAEEVAAVDPEAAFTTEREFAKAAEAEPKAPRRRGRT